MTRLQEACYFVSLLCVAFANPRDHVAGHPSNSFSYVYPIYTDQKLSFATKGQENGDGCQQLKN